MVVIKAHFDGKVIVPDEPVSFAPNQKLRITVEPADRGIVFSPHAESTVELMTGDPLNERDIVNPKPLDSVPSDFVRKPGSGAGEIKMSDDFDQTPSGFEDYR